MKPQDAAHWLQQACGIRLAQDPVVQSGNAVVPRQGSSVAASATVVLPAKEIASALDSLRNNRSLHSRGQSDTRYSYESYPDVMPVKACEVDTALRVIYFSYLQ
ncbi:MAG: hypothetical protein ABI616_11740 [Pseudomonadota bacterium]